MENQLHSYKVKLQASWEGVSADEEKQLIADYLDELHHRPHLMNVKMSLVKPGLVEIELVTELLPPEMERIKGGLEEELLEALSAVIREFKNYCRVKAIEIEEIT
jgi:hypothetical protein